MLTFSDTCTFQTEPVARQMLLGRRLAAWHNELAQLRRDLCRHRKRLERLTSLTASLQDLLERPQEEQS